MPMVRAFRVFFLPRFPGRIRPCVDDHIAGCSPACIWHLGRNILEPLGNQGRPGFAGGKLQGVVLGIRLRCAGFLCGQHAIYDLGAGQRYFDVGVAEAK